MSDHTTHTQASAGPIGAASKVTLWYRKGDKGFEFNHIEDGHSSADRPTPKTASQTKSWASGDWVSEHAWLNADMSPKVLHDSQNKLARKLKTD